jgi:hypothetical protein
VAEPRKGRQSEPRLRETIEMLCTLIASAGDPESRVEAEVGRLRNELSGKLRAASLRVAQLEQTAARLRGIADTIDYSGAP